MESQEDIAERDDSSWSVSGGVLADKIGTGKTCVGLALIDKSRCLHPPMLSNVKSKVPSRASLVVVPPNICDQWRREVAKFLRSGTVQVLFAQDINDVKCWSIGDVEEADLVIVSYRVFASKSYWPRRKQLDESFGKGGFNDKCPMVAEHMKSTKFPVFELFHFHRIVFDEFHELVEAVQALKHPFREAAQSLCRIESSHRWGITSTPPLGSIEAIVAMASLFQVTLRPQVDAVTEFVAKFVRRSSTMPALVSLVQRKVLVQQTVHERALYLLRRWDGVSERDLLEFASTQWAWSAADVYGQLRGSHDTAPLQSAQEICKSKLQELYRPIHEFTAKLKEAVFKFKYKNGEVNTQIRSLRNIMDEKSEHELGKQLGSQKALQVLAHFLEDHRLNKEPQLDPKSIKGKDLGVEGKRETIISLTRALGDEYNKVLFFESSLDESDMGVQCPVCFNSYSRADGCIADCGHMACSQCWSAILGDNPKCPICRKAITEGTLITLSAGTELKPVPGATRGGHQASSRTAFGSKMDCLLGILADIETQDSAAKVLVFCQFDRMKLCILKVFKEFDVKHVHLEGNTEQRGNIVRQFLSPTGPKILLSSMAVSPSGLDLSVANHVIVVQPTCHEDGDDMKSVDFEAQSIGRCWRMGQEQPVFVHRLCMADTVEEPVVDHHMHLWCAKFGAVQ